MLSKKAISNQNSVQLSNLEAQLEKQEESEKRESVRRDWLADIDFGGAVRVTWGLRAGMVEKEWARSRGERSEGERPLRTAAM